jgi:hypothetical protein
MGNNFIATQQGCTANNRFGNRLADGSIIGYKSISAIVPAGNHKFSF